MVWLWNEDSQTWWWCWRLPGPAILMSLIFSSWIQIVLLKVGGLRMTKFWRSGYWGQVTPIPYWLKSEGVTLPCLAKCFLLRKLSASTGSALFPKKECVCVYCINVCSSALPARHQHSGCSGWFIFRFYVTKIGSWPMYIFFLCAKDQKCVIAIAELLHNMYG